VGKASRQRRQKQREEARARSGGSHPGAAFGFGPEAGPEPGPETVRTEAEGAVAAIGQAVMAVRDGHQDVYARTLTQLASERTPVWTMAVSHSLIEMLQRSVTQAWRGGWQPAELTRHAGRELSQQHAAMAADMIIGEMRAYPAAAVHPRWAAQVRAAAPDGEPWWKSDADYAAAWAKRSGAVGGLRDAIATAIELLALLYRMPVLEQLLPLPGTAQAATARRAAPARPAGQSGEADERVLGRIRALLAKAESTEYGEEAEALSARAQELMTKYSIDQALLAVSAGRDDQPAGRRIAVDNPYEGPKTSLLQAVALANRCRVVWLRDVGLATLVGFEADLDAVEVLFTSLLVQADTAMLRAGSRQDARGASRTRAFRQSFLVAYAIRIGERLAETAEHTTQEAAAEQAALAGGDATASAGTALVPFLAARRQAVDDAVDEIFGGSVLRGRTQRITDAEGWTSGRAAADLASLHNHAPAVSS
jgi:hypothetical protein